MPPKLNVAMTLFTHFLDPSIFPGLAAPPPTSLGILLQLLLHSCDEIQVLVLPRSLPAQCMSRTSRAALPCRDWWTKGRRHQASPTKPLDPGIRTHAGPHGLLCSLFVAWKYIMNRRGCTSHSDWYMHSYVLWMHNIKNIICNVNITVFHGTIVNGVLHIWVHYFTD